MFFRTLFQAEMDALCVQDRETCLCLKHENMQYLLDKLHFLGVVSTAEQDSCFAHCAVM